MWTKWALFHKQKYSIQRGFNQNRKKSLKKHRKAKSKSFKDNKILWIIRKCQKNSISNNKRPISRKRSKNTYYNAKICWKTTNKTTKTFSNSSENKKKPSRSPQQEIWHRLKRKLLRKNIKTLLMRRLGFKKSLL